MSEITAYHESVRCGHGATNHLDLSVSILLAGEGQLHACTCRVSRAARSPNCEANLAAAK